MLSALNKPLDLSTQLAELRRWWAEAATPRIATHLPAWLSEVASTICIRFLPQGVRLTFRRGGEEPYSIDLAQEALAERWPGFLVECGLARSEAPTIVAVLPEQTSLTRQFRLPRAARSNLRAAAALQIDLETPFHHPDVFFSAAVVEDVRRDKQLVTELAVEPAKTTAPILKLLENAAIKPDVLTIAEDAEEAPRHNLLPAINQNRLSLQQKGILLCAVSLICGLIAAAYLPLYFHQAEANAVVEKAAALSRSAGDITGLFEKARQIRKRDGYALGQKLAHPSLVEVLQTLTAVTPDDTWIERFSYRPDQIQISGMTASTSVYTDRLLANPMFVQPVYLSPIARDPQSNLERFSLSFKLRAQ
jgi:general secretion pathway protein L